MVASHGPAVPARTNPYQSLTPAMAERRHPAVRLWPWRSTKTVAAHHRSAHELRRDPDALPKPEARPEPAVEPAAGVQPEDERDACGRERALVIRTWERYAAIQRLLAEATRDDRTAASQLVLLLARQGRTEAQQHHLAGRLSPSSRSWTPCHARRHRTTLRHTPVARLRSAAHPSAHESWQRHSSSHRQT